MHEVDLKTWRRLSKEQVSIAFQSQDLCQLSLGAKLRFYDMLFGEETLMERLYNQISTANHEVDTLENELVSHLKAVLLLRQRIVSSNLTSRPCFASILPDPRIIGPSRLHLHIHSFLTPT